MALIDALLVGAELDVAKDDEAGAAFRTVAEQVQAKLVEACVSLLEWEDGGTLYHFSIGVGGKVVLLNTTMDGDMIWHVGSVPGPEISVPIGVCYGGSKAKALSKATSALARLIA